MPRATEPGAPGMKPDQPSPRFPPSLALVTGVLAVSTGAIFARLSEASPLVTAAWRVGLATLLLAPFAWWKARAELRSLTRQEFALAALSGVLLALHFATWISSLSFTTVANSVVLVNTNPVWVALLTPWLTQDRVSARAWLGVGVSVAGGAVIGCGDFAGGTRALLGDGLALAGGLAAAGYLLLGRRLRARLSLLAYVSVCYGSAAVVLWLAVLLAGLPVSGFSGQTWAAFFGMAIVSQNLGHSSYNWALKHFGASVIAVSLLGEPVLSSLAAWWLFGEALTWLKAAGATLILVGIYVSATVPSAPANGAVRAPEN
jgi:drug/metabolite transporter (DMT)-like permease